jgi:signal transduction histidine kinase
MSRPWLIQGAVLAVAALLVALAVRLTVIEYILGVEAREAATAAARAAAGIRAEHDRIATLAGDWSLWDDAYRHALGDNPGFAQEINQVILDANGLALIAILDRPGRVVTAAARAGGEPATFAALADPKRSALAPLLDLPELDSRTALFAPSEHGPMLAAAFPLRTGAGAGPAAGTVLMGALVDASLLQRLGGDVGGEVTLVEGAFEPVQRLDGGRIAAVHAIPIGGSTVAVMVTRPRTLVSGTLGALAWTALAVAIIAIVAGAVLLRLLRKQPGTLRPWPVLAVGGALAATLLAAAWRTDGEGSGHLIAQIAGIGALVTGLAGIAVWQVTTLLRERERQRREAAAAITRERAALQAAMFAHLPLIAWCQEADGTLTAANLAFTRELDAHGTDPGAGHTACPVLAALTADPHAIATGVAVHHRVRIQDGAAIRWFEVAKTPLPGPDGRTGVIGFALDVTRRQADEEERRIAAERTALAANAAGVGIWEWQPDAGVMSWDARMRELHGIGASDTAPEAKAWCRMALAPDGDGLGAALDGATRDGHAMECEIRIPCDGRLRWLRISAAPLRDPDGTVRRIVGVARDMTREREREASLDQAMRRAQSADQAKSEFLATMSHEIRTPLNGILGTTQLLIDSPLDDAQRDLALIAKASAESLLALISDILDLSRIEAGRLDLERIPFDLLAIADGCLATMSARAHAKGLRLVLHVGPGLDTARIGDPNRLRQILLNLLGNAVKFTERGRVWIRIETTDGDRIRMVVGDSGIGIDPARIGDLFQPFQQADSSMARRYGGSGLGLAIVRRLAELMGGTVSAQSDPGRGSCFTVELPIPCAGSQPRPGSGRVRVRIVDPDPEARIGLASQVAAAGSVTVEDAAEADLTLWHADAGRPPDTTDRVILIGPPGLEGAGRPVLTAPPGDGAADRPALEPPGRTSSGHAAPRMSIRSSHPGGRRPSREPAGSAFDAGETGAYGDHRQRWCSIARSPPPSALRPRAHGLPDARHGWLRSHPPHPCGGCR